MDELLKTTDRSVNISDSLEVESTRLRKLTEKGIELKLQNLRGKFRRSVSDWKSQANDCLALLADSDDCNEIRDFRSQLNACFKSVSVIADEFVLFEESQVSDMIGKFEEFERDHMHLMLKISETLRYLQSEKASSRSSKHSKMSHNLSEMSKMEYLAESVRLKTKLKFHDIETKMKADLEKLQTVKQLEVVNAKARAVDDFEQIPGLKMSEVEKLPSDDANTFVKDYVENQAKFQTMPNATTEVVPPHISNSLSAPLHTSSEPQDVKPNTDVQPPLLNPSAPAFVPPLLSNETATNPVPLQPNAANSLNQGLIDLARSLADQVSLNRLPPPEPNIFYGDPIQYPTWKTSFKTLIDSRKIPPNERIHYLKRYVGGPVRQVIENYFLCPSDNAYEEAWKLLNERYGDPFVVASAFRDRLDSWQRIQAKDSASLLKFSDFLRQCLTAMSDVAHLTILNDCRENRRMLTKLPDWLVLRWNRLVTSHRESTKEFPSFKLFVDFVSKEARIASDPVTSIQSLKGNQENAATIPFKNHRQHRNPTNVNKSVVSRSFLSSSKYGSPNSSNTSYKKVTVCCLCKKNHDLDECRLFLDKSMAERKSFVKDNNLCFGCLSFGHLSKFCTHRKVCKVCKKLHATAFHGDKVYMKPNADVYADKTSNKPESSCMPSPAAKSEMPNTGATSGMAFLNSLGGESKCSAIVPVYLSHSSDPNSERLVYALLDSQSDTTFVLRDTLASLGQSGTPVHLSLSTMHAADKMVSSEKISGLLVRGYDSFERITLPVTYTRDIMPANRSHIPTDTVAGMWPHLEGIASKLMSLNSCEIGLLIGYNCPRALLPREIIPPEGEGPFGQRTDLGWSIVGIVNQGHVEGDDVGLSHRVVAYEVPPRFASDGNECVKSVLFSVKTSVKEIINTDVLRLMERDFCDSVEANSALSQEDRQFLSTLENGISFKDGHYEMPLPFRKLNPVLPNNRSLALSRFKSLQRRLQADDKFCKHYTHFMDSLVSKGHAERVPDSSFPNNTVWYIPHHGVYHPHKPDKIRVVFDCSSEFRGHSLNQHLLHGPDLTNKLFGVLCRFRKEPVAIICDIEQMFYQFKVTPECRDYLRFLWWDSNSYSCEPVDFRMTVHLFGAASSPGCANYGLKRVASDNQGSFGDAATSFIHNDFYVDDGVKSVSNVSEAIDLIGKTKAMCAKGGLRLHKFVSNSKEVIQSLDPEDRAQDLINIDLAQDKLPLERALGILWCVESDTFQFKIVLKDRPLTRRGILSSVSCLYDPLGLIAPVVLQGKQILQMMCAEKADWDDPLPAQLQDKWKSWRESLDRLSSLKIDRCVRPKNFGIVSSIELHHFSDASSYGYGQCSYVRFINHESKIHCALLMGKSRVVPLKPITIPRLELVAAVLSVKSGNMLQQELQYENVKHVYWTDSKVVLGYICNETRRFHVFVANRVQQIRDHSESYQWHHVSTDQNPADIASRGILANELVGNNIWFNGPSFLWEPNLDLDTNVGVSVDPDDPEVKKAQTFLANQGQISRSFPTLLERLRYFSKWNCAKRAIAWCLRLKKKLRLRSVKKPCVNLKSLQFKIQSPSVQELNDAEIVICRAVQAVSFKDEIGHLESTNVVDVPANRKEVSLRRRSLRSSSQLSRLDPFLDCYGILRVGGRIQNSNLAENFKHPIVLPTKGHVTELVVRHFHEKCMHQGRGITTNVIRQNGFWVVGCSSVVSSLLSKCVICRKLRGTVQEQKMSSLPDDRLEPAPPFTYCAVDLFGPFIIREGRKELKRYGVLFTCMACRAVHVETVNSLETDAFINCLRRFISLRGPIRQLRSDRGTNFVGAENELNQALCSLDDNKLQQFLLSQNCDFFTFKMNVPAASHMGGVWERQIRSVRSVLAYLLHTHGSQLDDESLRTFLCEAAAIVNCRPLTVDNLNDPTCVSPLTPNNLLTMKSNVILPPPGNFQREDVYCRKRWRRTQYLIDQFWNRWKVEFLQNLQVRSKWLSPRRNMCIGDVVIIKDDNISRNQWRLGRLVETTEDDDGLVRKVKVALADPSLDNKGKRKSTLTVLERPIQKVVLLHETEEIPVGKP